MWTRFWSWVYWRMVNKEKSLSNMLCPCYCSRFSNTLSCVNSPRKCSIFMTHTVKNKLNFLQRVFNFYLTEVDGEFSRCKQILYFYLACENLEFSNSNWSVSNSSMNPFLFTWITKHHPLNHSRKNVWLVNLVYPFLLTKWTTLNIM